MDQAPQRWFECYRFAPNSKRWRLLHVALTGSSLYHSSWHVGLFLVSKWSLALLLSIVLDKASVAFQEKIWLNIDIHYFCPQVHFMNIINSHRHHTNRALTLKCTVRTWTSSGLSVDYWERCFCVAVSVPCKLKFGERISILTCCWQCVAVIWTPLDVSIGSDLFYTRCKATRPS